MSEAPSRVRSALFVLSFIVVFALNGRGGQGPQPALCDAIASTIRGGGEPMRKVIELAPEFDLAARSQNGGELVQEFVKRFNPSSALQVAFSGFAEYGYIQFYRLPGSATHVVVNTAGSATCFSYLFFRYETGGQGQLLPPIPPKGTRDGDNLICGGYGNTGYLARIQGNDVFVEYGQDAIANTSSYRVVPLRGNQWDRECRVNAAYRTEYKLGRVALSSQGAPSASDFSDLAMRAVRIRAAAKDAASFSLAPVLSESERTAGRRMSELATKLENSEVPRFSNDSDSPVVVMDSSDAYPVRIGENLYLLRIGHPNIGWRVFPDWVVILYRLDGDKLVPAATATVEQSAGELDSLQVSTG